MKKIGALFLIISVSLNSASFSMDDICGAVICGHLARVQEILQTKPDAVHVRWGMLGSTPLHLAVGRGNEAIARLLLEHRADIDARNIDIIRETPLHIAVENGNEAIVRLLLEHRANIDARNIIHKTPLHIAARNGHEAIAQLLRDWPMYRAYMAHHSLPTDQAFAFLQATHPRLGAASLVRNLPPCLMRHITEIATYHTLDEIHQMADQERRELELAAQSEGERRNRALSYLGGGAAATAVATVAFFAYRFFKRR